MSYKWKPSASQRKAFAEKMKNPAEQAAYEERKNQKAEKRRAGSQFDYATAGGQYIPTQSQYDYACSMHSKLTGEIKQAFDLLISAYTCNQKVHHDIIHQVNEHLRNQVV